MSSSKFDAYFQNTFFLEHLWVAASVTSVTLQRKDKYFLKQLFAGVL